MGWLVLVRTALNSVGLLLSNPLLGGGGSVKAQQAAELLEVLDMILEEGEDGYEDLKAFTEQVQAMADENRGPTPAEWDMLRARKDAAHDRLQAVKEEILGEEEQEAPENPDPVSSSEAPEGETSSEEPTTGV